MTHEQVKVDLSGLCQEAQGAVLAHSQPLSNDIPCVCGFTDYEKAGSITVSEMLTSFSASGFQASHLGQAARIIEQMLNWRLADEPDEEGSGDDPANEFSWSDMAVRERTRAKIFLSFTSNMISSGLREAFVYLAKHRLVDVIVTTAGGIEEDIIKCLGKSALGTFSGIKGSELRAKGWNRIGNIYVPNDNYVRFESWLQPLLDRCLTSQRSEGIIWTPSKLIREMGKEINDETSLYYWCYKNDIEVYCPCLTDGSIGDNLYFHASRNPGLIIDVVRDIAAINRSALVSKRTGMIVLGGGAAKHHICNANLMRNGADYAVYINTAQEYDGCDSGAAPDEAVSWGKIKANAATVKVCCDATIAFPLLVADVFKKVAESRKANRRTLPPRAATSVAWYNTADGFILSSPWHEDT